MSRYRPGEGLCRTMTFKWALAVSVLASCGGATKQPFNSDAGTDDALMPTPLTAAGVFNFVQGHRIATKDPLAR